MTRAAWLPLLLAACTRPAPPPPGSRPGDAILVDADQGISDPFGLQRFIVDSVAGDQVSATLFGSHRTYALADTTPVAGLERGCPAGEIVLVRVTEAMWDVSLALGGDGESCFVMATTGSEAWDPDRVHRLPPAWSARFAGRRRDLGLAWATHGWPPARPAGWRPGPGDEVLVRVGSRRAAPQLVAEARPYALRVGADQWVSDRQIAPLPDGSHRAVPGDVVHPTGELLVFMVVAADATGVTVARGHDGEGPPHLAHDAYVILRPPAAAGLPALPARADVVGRSLLLRDLLVDLGAIHSRRPPARPGVLVYIRADGSPVAEADVEPLGDDHELALRGAEASGALAVDRIGKEQLGLRDLRLTGGQPLPAALR